MEFACYAGWEALPAGVDQLFATAERESIFFSRPWFENLLENSQEEGRTLLLACVLDGNQVLALLPLSQQDGGHCHPLKHLYTSLYSLLLHESRQEQILNCLIEGLRQLPVRSLQLEPAAERDLSVQFVAFAYGLSASRCSA